MALQDLIKKATDPDWIQSPSNLEIKDIGKLTTKQRIINAIETIKEQEKMIELTPTAAVIDISDDHILDAANYTKDAVKRIKKENKKQSFNPLDGLQAWIEEVARSGVNEEKVREIVAEAISLQAPKRIEVAVADKVNQIEGLVHFQFELVLKAMCAGVNIAMTGPTATSKTTMAIQAAKALGRDYMVFKPIFSASGIEGYNSATGSYVESNVYRAHKGGMIAIFDEFDASDPTCALMVNSLLDNKTFTYPNGETVENQELQVVVTMNTSGTGPDRKFVGRNRLDAATIDRFCVIEVERDLSLEAALIGVVEPKKDCCIHDGGIVDADYWLRHVRERRAHFERTKPDKVISTRAVRDGWKLIQAGIGLDWAEKMTITK